MQSQRLKSKFMIQIFQNQKNAWKATIFKSINQDSDFLLEMKLTKKSIEIGYLRAIQSFLRKFSKISYAELKDRKFAFRNLVMGFRAYSGGEGAYLRKCML